ncbi:MAG: ABC transporter ATP-binding protein [Firmicutes bacterium]|nr:ABC transporter ATP-binding protein [Bacillota bacterium]
MTNLLELRGITSGYDKMQILWEPDIHVADGECVLILGSNGAGKTTLLKSLVGLLPAWTGTIVLDGQAIHTHSVDQRIRAGISYVSELGIIPTLSIEDNLKLGAFYVPAQERAQRLREMYDQFPILAEKRRGLGSSLSGGHRKVLSTAKALMSRPRLLVMDEPSAGLSPLLVAEIISILQELHTEGLSMIIAEQNVKFLDIADRVYVLDSGRIGFSGTVQELKDDDAIQRAYFGVTRHG